MVKKSAEKGTQKIMQSHVQIFVRERKKRKHRERERELDILLRIPPKRIRAENKGKMTTMRLFNA